MLECFTSMYVYTYTTCISGLWRGQKKTFDPRTEDIDGCWPSCRCWDLNPGPYQEQQVLFLGDPPPPVDTNNNVFLPAISELLHTISISIVLYKTIEVVMPDPTTQSFFFFYVALRQKIL